MQRIRKLAALAGVTVLAGAFVANPAGADSAEAYMGSAAARGLNISVVTPLDAAKNFKATLGAASAKATSALTAEATGTGQVLPDLLSTSRTASASAQKLNDNPDKGCALPLNLVDVVDLGIACGDAQASIANDLPVAISEGSVAGLTVDGKTALDRLDAVTEPIGATLETVLDTVCTSLSQACPATTTVEDLINSILDTRTLDVSVGKSTASVVTEAGKVTSSAQASGAVVKILPLPQVSGLPSTEPLATIEVSSAKATAVYDRVTGTSVPAADPALVRVKFNTALTQSLGVNEIAVQPGVTQDILAGTPLHSRIIVAGTQNVTNPDKSVGAIADGVKLQLLMPLGESAAGALDGGVTLELAHAEAGVAGAPKEVTPIVPQVQLPDVPRELPRTGGNAWLPIAGASVLALAVLVRRTVLKAAPGR
jgi:LPXTG-motif cell wall-anchored protein